MSNIDINKAVAAHYGRGDLTERILNALGANSAGSLTLATLAQIDQLHHGGLSLTERLVSVAEIARGMHVLDAGSGIGGASRHLASVCGCTIEAIDLTPEFVRTGAELNELVGLSESISHCVGSVTELPYENNSFDAVWSQNVTMNIADKSTMFAEALRVLRPGGVFAFTHLTKGNGEAVDYPMPWADSAETSFLGTRGEIFETLKDVGFERATNYSSGDAPPPLPLGDSPDDTVVMGKDMPLRGLNAKNAVIDGRLVPMMVTARRRA